MTPDYDVTMFETWRLKAEEDFTAASILAEHGGPAATICFLCQQVAEKYLKGYLLLRRQPPKRIHHLDALLSKTALHSTIHSNGWWMTPCSSSDTTSRAAIPTTSRKKSSRQKPRRP
jgi:HEPN domain